MVCYYTLSEVVILKNDYYNYIKSVIYKCYLLHSFNLPKIDRSTYQYRLISTTKHWDTCSEVSLFLCLEKGYLFILVNLPERVGELNVANIPHETLLTSTH